MPKPDHDPRDHRPNRSYNVAINYGNRYGAPGTSRPGEVWRSLRHWGVDVSDQGRVRDYYTEQFLHIAVTSKHGHAIVHVYPPSDQHVDKMVGNLVAEAFLPPPDSREPLRLHHKNLDRTDCTAANLTYAYHRDILNAYARARPRPLRVRPPVSTTPSNTHQSLQPQGAEGAEDPDGPTSNVSYTVGSSWGPADYSDPEKAAGVEVPGSNPWDDLTREAAALRARFVSHPSHPPVSEPDGQ